MNHRRRSGVATGAGAVLGLFGILLWIAYFICWCIVMGAIVAVAGDVVGLWEVVGFV